MQGGSGMNKHYRITSGDKLGAVRKKSSGASIVNKPVSLGMHTSPSGVSTQSTHSTKTNQSGISQQSRISSLQQDLFAKLDQATSHRIDDDGFDKHMDELDRLEQLGTREGMAEPRDKFEHLASLGKNYVASNAADGFEAQKQAYRAKEMAKKREEKRVQKRKLLSQVPRDQDKVMLTGAGIEQIEADDDEDDDEHLDPDELRDDVGGLYELEDQEMIDLMNECLDEVKRDVLKYQRGEEDDLAEIRRLIKEVDAEKNAYKLATGDLSKKFIGMRTGLNDAGCRYDKDVFDKIEKQSSKIYGSMALNSFSMGESQEDRSTSKKGLKKGLSSDSNGLKKKKLT